MPSLEAVCTRLFGRPGWIPKVLLGGGLSFIPGLNLFSLGYLFIYGRRLRRSQQIDLPEWSEMNWPELFVCGLRLFGLLVVYVGRAHDYRLDNQLNSLFPYLWTAWSSCVSSTGNCRVLFSDALPFFISCLS